METTVSVNNRPMSVRLSAAAERALRGESAPLVAEMELYFSCLIRKQVRFHRGEQPDDAVAVAEGLYVRFRPVMTRGCSVAEGGEAPPLTDFPIARPEDYVPHWLRIDYRAGEWAGEFGFA